MLRWAALILVLPLGRGFASDLVFSGSLERVGHESLSVRPADGRLIDARLPNTRLLAAGKIVAQYSLGDHVEIACKAIPAVWEDETARYQSLEVTRLRFLHAPSAEELSKLLAARAWREGVNLLGAPDGAVSEHRATQAAADDSRLAHVRKVNLDYAAHMPNFVADETATRYTSGGLSSPWQLLDTIQTEITIKGSRAVRQQIRRNGQPWTRPFQSLSGFKWYGGFGTEIKPLFNPQCPTTIEYSGRAEVRGKQRFEYRFRSPADGCFGPFTVEYQRFNPARTGRVLVEDPGGSVIQYEEDANGFPANFEISQRQEEVSWDYVKIGEASHLLPVGARFVVIYSSGNRARVEVEYKNHRHFEAATNITFH